jgi:hypothetical protein
MKLINILAVFLLTSCQALPQLYQAAEDIADDEAVQVKISREAIQKQTDITISIEIKNPSTTAAK